MPNCYICNTPLTTENSSEEHIILNACGGRLKSRSLICSSCNSRVGTEYDSALALQLNGLSNLLNIRRERGAPQPIKGRIESKEQDYWIHPDGSQYMVKPIIRESVEKDSTKIEISANNEREIKKILNGLKRKYPTLDVEKALLNVQKKSEHPDEFYHFNFTIGGEKPLRSIVKTAVSFYIFSGGKRNSISHTIPYLTGVNDANYAQFYVPDMPVHNLISGEISHVLYINADPKSGLLYVHIEFFNIWTYLVVLSVDYMGPTISNTYAYDVLHEEVIEKHVQIPMTPEEIKAYDFQTANINYKQIEVLVGRVLEIMNQRREKAELGEIVDNAVNQSLGTYPEGVPITEGMINEMVDKVMEGVIPILERKYSNKPKHNG